MTYLVDIINSNPSMSVSLVYEPNRCWKAILTGIELPNGNQSVVIESPSLTQALEDLTSRLSGRRFTVMATGVQIPAFKYVGF